MSTEEGMHISIASDETHVFNPPDSQSTNKRAMLEGE